jgi:amino acid transporter
MNETDKPAQEQLPLPPETGGVEASGTTATKHTVRIAREGSSPDVDAPASGTAAAPARGGREPSEQPPSSQSGQSIVPDSLRDPHSVRIPEQNLAAGGVRLSMAELDRREVVKGTHPGDQYLRRARHSSEGFRRLGPGHLEALPSTGAPSSGLGRALAATKRVLLGNPISTAAQHTERLNKARALAVYSSDALSSVAYATEAVLGALLVAGTAAFDLNIGVSIAIAILIGILVFSYRQTIYAYPSGGGSYIVAKDNLGTLPGLVAAASLLTDYILTVAVSVSAGVLAIYSLAPQLAPYRVEICLGAIALILILNLRGIRESGTVFAVPTYAFLVMVYTMLGFGIFQLLTGTLGTVGQVRDAIPPGDPHTGQIQTIGLVLILSAFSSGCTALTGIEAISNGVPAFKRPESRNAAQTMVSLGLLLASMFLGISFLADRVGAHPSTTESVLSQVGRTVFGPLNVSIGGQNLFWILLQWSTALILVLAANTSFADFPRLSYLLARDRFLPHLFSLRGDRLAFNVGIVVLALLSGVLIVIFDGDTTALLPLYAIGVFSSFTLSQSGMVRHWMRLKSPGWHSNAVVNGIGAVTTMVVLLILCSTKFAEGEPLFTVGDFTVHEGAWIIIVLVPLLVIMFRRIHSHYERVGRQLSLEGLDPAVGKAAEEGAVLPANPLMNLPGRAGPRNRLRRIEHLIVMPVAGLNKVTLSTVAYARSLIENVVAVHVAADEEPEQVNKLESTWHEWMPDVPLVIVESPYRSLLRPLLAYIDALHRQQPDRVLTVMIPEFVATHPWEYLLHNQSALRLKGALLFRPGIVVINVPYHIADKRETK